MISKGHLLEHRVGALPSPRGSPSRKRPKRSLTLPRHLASQAVQKWIWAMVITSCFGRHVRRPQQLSRDLVRNSHSSEGFFESLGFLDTGSLN